MEKIRIKSHVEGLILPSKMDNGDWIDLRAAEDVCILAGKSVLISLGISMKLPNGYEAHLAPRSSTYKHFGIIMTNSLGIVDNSFCGDDDIWMFPAYCLTPRHCEHGVGKTLIKKNDRICQFRIIRKQPDIYFEEVASLCETNRGGIGSTGIQ